MGDSPNRAFYAGLARLQAAPRHGDPVSAARSVLDEIVAESAVARDRACERGCAFCCHYPVGVTLAEARRIVERLGEVLDPDGLAEVVRRIRERACEHRSSTYEPGQRLRPCALLSGEGTCIVYEVRPLPCRAWHSTSRAACERAFADDDATPKPFVDQAAFAGGLGVAQGLAERLRAAGDDSEVHELHTALARVSD